MEPQFIDGGRRRLEGVPFGNNRAMRFGCIGIGILFLIVLIGAKWGASLLIDYSWWHEMGQVRTWFDLYAYSTLPVAAGTILAWIILLIAHSRAVRFAGGQVSDYPIYSRLSAVALLVLSFMVAGASLDNWTVLRFAGSRGMSGVGTFHDPIFGKPATFYLFDLPFWSDLRGYIFVVVILTILVYWLVARGWQLRFTLPELPKGNFDISFFHLTGGLESRFLRGALAFFFVALAARYYLARFEMVWNQHSRFMIGIDYTDEHFALPLYWVTISALIVGAGLIVMRRWVVAGAVVGVSLALLFIVPPVAGSLFVKPNEISLERPYIQAHIEATREAYGLAAHVHEVEMHTNPTATIDVVKNAPLLDNVRLWDWRPFHDTVTQMQALRPYYTFHEPPDVDRYTIDGKYRQVLLSARELDITQLPGTQSSWINPHFIYTHGYGLVLAEVNKITPEGQPVYLVLDMPPVVKTPSLKISQPELYYSEVQHEPVFVDTAQQEFNYPQGSDNALNRYGGKGGFPISSLLMRAAAAVHFGDSNIVLTGYLTDHSRMMIHRNIRERLETLAPYLSWDRDPYLVITPEGRLVWMCDGYTTSESYPFSRESEAFGGINYVRNAVKATVDAYDGAAHIYIFDPTDPIINAYRKLFPSLYEDAAAMPEFLRAHARYPEDLFGVQSELYRIYHMTNPQSFYNNEDVWELARYSSGNSEPRPVTPTYVFATLPGETKPEFMLMTTFTPFSKENLIGVMLARCDGPRLGEVVVLQLSKQELILGPMQINARINQDQNISKDLTLWNQQGSQVLQGQTLVLPMGDTFLYVSPLYLQATQARMPQLKKVVLAVGNRLIYADTYDEALAMLGNGQMAAPAPAPNPGGPPSAASLTTQTPSGDPRIQIIRQHLQRYRDLAAQGKWADAGKELEAVEAEVRR
ncbi:MAG TPA: UPF0182 family protein [Bryobacteraceae bacterium]|nr:UPF0182 family protein [Bryobacteraceae bacterium]